MLSVLISEYAGINEDAVTMALILFMILPISLIYERLVPPEAYKLKIFISISITLSIYIHNFEHWLLYHIFGSIFYTFGLSKYNICNPWAIFTLNFLHLFYVQWGVTQYFTATFMMTVVKNIMYSWDVRKDRDLRATNLLDYLGYIFFFPTFFAGPPFSFKYYFECVKRTTRTHTKISVLKCTAWAGLCLILLIKLSSFSYYNALQTEYSQLSFVKRFSLLQLYGFSSRLRYYMAWKISEASALVLGVGQTIDKNGHTHVDGIRNTNIIATEFAGNIRTTLKQWNRMTAIWLHDYVYENLIHANMSISFATYTTFLISAIWHGIHAGYYLSFASGAFFTSVARKMRKSFQPFIQKQHFVLQIIYKFFSWFLTWTSINYIAAPFMVFTIQNGLHIWKENYFICHVIALILNIIL